jgi:hypothetical protein
MAQEYDPAHASIDYVAAPPRYRGGNNDGNTAFAHRAGAKAGVHTERQRAWNNGLKALHLLTALARASTGCKGRPLRVLELSCGRGDAYGKMLRHLQGCAVTSGKSGGATAMAGFALESVVMCEPDFASYTEARSRAMRAQDDVDPHMVPPPVSIMQVSFAELPRRLLPDHAGRFDLIFCFFALPYACVGGAESFMGTLGCCKSLLSTSNKAAHVLAIYTDPLFVLGAIASPGMTLQYEEDEQRGRDQVLYCPYDGENEEIRRRRKTGSDAEGNWHKFRLYVPLNASITTNPMEQANYALEALASKRTLTSGVSISFSTGDECMHDIEEPLLPLPEHFGELLGTLGCAWVQEPCNLATTGGGGGMRATLDAALPGKKYEGVRTSIWRSVTGICPEAERALVPPSTLCAMYCVATWGIAGAGSH